MKNTLIAILVIYAISCAPKKIVTQSNTDTQSHVANAISDTNNSQNTQAKVTTDQSATDTETTVHITTYDNEKPVDTITGKHPVKEEKVIATKKVKKADVKTDVNNTGTQIITHQDNSVTNTDSKIEVKTKEIPKTPAIKYWLYLVVIIGGSFLVWKYFDKIKALFSLIFK